MRISVKEGEPVRRYYCFRCQGRPSLLASNLEGPVWEAVKLVLASPELVWTAIETVSEPADLELAQEIAEAETKLQRIRVERTRIIGMARRKEIGTDDLSRELKASDKRSALLRTRLDALRCRAAAGNGKEELLAHLIGAVGEDGEGLDSMSPEERKSVMELVLSEVRVDADNKVRLLFGIPLDPSLCYEPAPDDGTGGNLAGKSHRVRLRPEEVSAGVRKILEVSGMTQGQLAQRLKVSQRTVNRWAAGGLPYADHLADLIRVAEDLGLSDAFLSEEDILGGNPGQGRLPFKIFRKGDQIFFQATLDL